MIKAIETRYKGHRFRSRLEARWAVFFDAVGVEWRYEVEGFESPCGDRYLPDFYLPKTETWVEVKGEQGALQKDWQRMVRLLDWGGVLPNFADSAKTSRGLLLLGDIPYVSDSDFGHVLHPVIQHHEGLQQRWMYFIANSVGAYCRIADLGDMAMYFEALPRWGLEGSPEYGWLIESRFVRTARGYNRVLDAYRAARSARFEHGEASP